MRFSAFNVHGEITTLPGCSQIGVSHAVYSKDPGKGNGKAANEARQKFMSDMGYDYALCTVDAANARQIAIMEKNGWTHLDGFLSSKTGHSVRIYGKRLP